MLEFTDAEKGELTQVQNARRYERERVLKFLENELALENDLDVAIKNLKQEFGIQQKRCFWATGIIDIYH